MNYTFTHNIGRPKTLTASEAYNAKLEAKRKWRRENRERVSAYNEMYRETHGSKKRHSKKSSKHHGSRRRHSKHLLFL